MPYASNAERTGGGEQRGHRAAAPADHEQHRDRDRDGVEQPPERALGQHHGVREVAVDERRPDQRQADRYRQDPGEVGPQPGERVEHPQPGLAPAGVDGRERPDRA